MAHVHIIAELAGIDDNHVFWALIEDGADAIAQAEK